jgi:hypothetical protein
VGLDMGSKFPPSLGEVAPEVAKGKSPKTRTIVSH